MSSLKTGYDDNGPAWIGRVTFSKTGQTIYSGRRHLGELSGRGHGRAVLDLGGEEELRRRHWASAGAVEIDDDAREEYERLVSPPK